MPEMADAATSSKVLQVWNSENNPAAFFDSVQNGENILNFRSVSDGSGGGQDLEAECH